MLGNRRIAPPVFFGTCSEDSENNIENTLVFGILWIHHIGHDCYIHSLKIATLGQRHTLFFLGNLLKIAQAANMKKTHCLLEHACSHKETGKTKQNSKRQQSEATIDARTAIGILGRICCCAGPTATSIRGFDFLGCWFVI